MVLDISLDPLFTISGNERWIKESNNLTVAMGLKTWLCFQAIETEIIPGKYVVNLRIWGVSPVVYESDQSKKKGSFIGYSKSTVIHLL